MPTAENFSRSVGRGEHELQDRGSSSDLANSEETNVPIIVPSLRSLLLFPSAKD